jgi:hypothetical protein
MSDKKKKPSKLREKIRGIVKMVGLPAWIKIAKFLGIPIHKDP